MISEPLQPVRTGEALAQGVRHTAASLLEDAVVRLRDPGRDGVEKTVHETRKRIKELRALLRLVDKDLVDQGKGPVRPAANQRLRTAAGMLGAARDSAVLLETLESVARHPRSPHGAIGLVREWLQRKHEAEGEPPAGTLAEARGLLERVHGEVAGWEIEAGEAWEAIGPSLRLIYQRGRRAFAAARQAEDAETWHEWRKRSKDLRYALELLRESSPQVMAGQVVVAKTLTDDLGEDHDLAVLLECLPAMGSAVLEEGELAPVISDMRGAAWRKASRVGEWVYAEKAGAFQRRMASYWRTACRWEETGS